jgi:hypothetical protein
MESRVQMEEHPLLRALSSVDAALDEVAELDPAFLPTRDKARALTSVSRELARLEGLRLQLLAAAGDVAEDRGARSAGVWLTGEIRGGAATGAFDQRLAEATARWAGVGRALREGRINPAQTAVIVRALHALPSDLDAELAGKAEARLLADAGHFGPRELRVLGRRVLEAVAPSLAEREEERLLRAEEDRGRAELRVSFRPRGDGVTDVCARVPEQVADRFRVYLEAFTAPRRLGSATAARTGRGDTDWLTLPRRRGEAFCALLEHLPTDGLPTHGGTATSVMVMIDLESLRSGCGAGITAMGAAMTASDVRRLACSAGVLPVVLGGAGEVLDLGRSRRLFSPAQRKAMAIRDRRCRADGCEIPAAWCEAHHAGRPWSQGGKTDLKDGVLLCSFHHHRAHHAHWRADRLPHGGVRFTRRT